MCNKINEKNNKNYKTSIICFLAICLGVLSGLSNIEFIQNIGFFISDLFIKVFKCISLPILALSLITALSAYDTETLTKKIWHRLLFYTLATTIIAASVSCFLYLLIKPANLVMVLSDLSVPANQPKMTYFQHILNLIPANIFSPFLEHQVVGVLCVGIVIGIGTRLIPDAPSRQTLTSFFKGAQGLFFIVTGWVVILMPLAFYGFMTTFVIQWREGVGLEGIGQYLSIVVLSNVIQGVVILPLWLWFNHVRPFHMMRGMLPALSMAFFSKSSSGTLPVTIEMAEKNLGISPQISRFVLPLCTSINMNGCAAFIFTTVIYLMQNHGVEITFSTLLLWIVIATIAAVGNAGVPMGCFFLSASLLANMDIPLTLLGIILPFYSFIDMIETALNVWSDACIAKVVHDKTMHEKAK